MTYFDDYKKMLNDALDSIDQDALQQFAEELYHMADGRTPLLVCGNGGSAAIAEHMSCDHTKGICMDTNLDPFVIPLASNVSLITAIANDIGYHEVFSKQIEWFSDPNAVVLVISSSGNSPNILKALQAAKSRGMYSMALVGFDGGAAKDLANLTVHVKSNNYGIIEDCHQIIMHMVAQNIRTENCILPAKPKL